MEIDPMEVPETSRPKESAEKSAWFNPAVASPTRLPGLCLLALLAPGLGVQMGLAGLLGWVIHPDALILLPS